jgi:hypothetical protein
MATKISTNNGDFVLKFSYDYETGESYYDVYLPASDDECGYGEWQGEYFPNFDIDEEYDEFVNHFEVWLDANDIVNLG